MADVIELVFPEPLHGGGSVHTSRLAEFNADPVTWVWDTRDPVTRDDKLWLDGNAPGWKTSVATKAYRTRTFPIGTNPVGSFLDYEVTLLFTKPAHRDAWRERIRRSIDQNEQLRSHVAARRAAAGVTEEICDCCGGLMETCLRTETIRISQFAFTRVFPVLDCPGCGACIDCSLNTDAIDDAIGMANLRVGLPLRGDILWTEAATEERTRRRNAPPEIEIRITDDMSSADIINRLDTELYACGRHFGGKPKAVQTELSNIDMASDHRLQNQEIPTTTINDVNKISTDGCTEILIRYVILPDYMSHGHRPVTGFALIDPQVAEGDLMTIGDDGGVTFQWDGGNLEGTVLIGCMAGHARLRGMTKACVEVILKNDFAPAFLDFVLRQCGGLIVNSSDADRFVQTDTAWKRRTGSPSNEENLASISRLAVSEGAKWGRKYALMATTDPVPELPGTKIRLGACQWVHQSDTDAVIRLWDESFKNKGWLPVHAQTSQDAPHDDGLKPARF